MEGLEIKVPITLKGGREGEKVGKQIGEKLAVQLKKTLGAVKIGGPGNGMGPASMIGVSKGLKGVAGKLGVVAAALGIAVGVLAKASPYLKGILDIFGRAFMIFFRPFGDFLATLLRPLAILLMKMAVAFLKWTRPITKEVGEAMAEAPQIELVDNALANFAIGIANWGIRLGAGIAAFVVEIGKALADAGAKFGLWLYEKVIEPVGTFISGKMSELWEIIKSPFVWLAEQIRSFLGGIFGGGKTGLGAPVMSGEGAGVPTGSIAQYLATGGPSGGPVPAGGIAPKGINKSVVLSPTFNFTGGFSKEMDMDEMARKFGRTTEMELKQRGVI